MSEGMTDRELLGIEIETLWESDSRGQLVRARDDRASVAPFVVLATAADGWLGAVSASLDEHLAQAIVEAMTRTPMPARPALPPQAVIDLSELLTASGVAAEFHSGPSFLVPRETNFAPTGRIVTSADSASERPLLFAPPEANWPAGEWNSLLAGEIGPWAMALDGENVVAICHSSRLIAEAAEAGAWTHPEQRGRGHAAAVTAAWASLVRASGRLPFYSTSAGNLSSRRVAERLNLHPLGWLWSYRPPEEEPLAGSPG